MMTLNLHQISLATKVHTAQYNDRAQLQIPTGFEKPAKSFILPHPILLWNTDEYYIKMILAQASTQSCFSSQYLQVGKTENEEENRTLQKPGWGFAKNEKETTTLDYVGSMSSPFIYLLTAEPNKICPFGVLCK